MHEVQSRLETALPLSMTCTFWMLMSQWRRVALLDQGRLLPYCRPRLHPWHFAITYSPIAFTLLLLLYCDYFTARPCCYLYKRDKVVSLTPVFAIIPQPFYPNTKRANFAIINRFINSLPKTVYLKQIHKQMTHRVHG